jgi:hypothetical protein
MVIDKKDEVKDDEVVVLDENITDEDTQDPDQEIEIDLDTDEDEDEDGKPDNKAFAKMRIENTELKKTVDEMNKKIDGLATVPAPATEVKPAPSATVDKNDPRTWGDAEWDALAKQDWKKAVDLRSTIQAENKIATSANENEFNKTMADSQSKVLLRHPELNDPQSEKSKVFRNIVTANPEYTTQRKGPLLAMYEMEDYMVNTLGKKREDVVKAETKAREDESARRDRVQLTSTTGRNLTEGNKVTVTKDEMEFCKLQGIDPKVYALNKKKLAGSDKGGVQL